MHDLTMMTSCSTNVVSLRNVSNGHGHSTLSSKRDAMKLDIDVQNCQNKRQRMLSLTDFAQELSSPFTNGMQDPNSGAEKVLETPTPTQFLFPKRVTEEQEDYARGFSRALEEIYQQRGSAVAIKDELIAGDSVVPSDTLAIPWNNISSASSYASDNYTISTSQRQIPSSLSSTSTTMIMGCDSVPLLPFYSTTTTASSTVSSSSAISPQVFHVLQPLLPTSSTSSINANICTSSILPSFASTVSNQFQQRSATTAMTTTAHFFSQGAQRGPVNLPMGNNPVLPRAVMSVRPTKVETTVTNIRPAAGFDMVGGLHDEMMTQNDCFENSYHSAHTATMKVKPELRDLEEMKLTLPPTSTFGLSMDEQERLKLERKRAKNRIAAQRCQQRKVEKISSLEEKVAALREQNSALMHTVSALGEHIAELKCQISAHADSGCRLLLPHMPAATR